MPEESTVLYANFMPTVGIEDLIHSVLDLYPNPATNYIMIYNDIPGLLKVWNTQGQLVISMHIDQNHHLDISRLKRGGYIVVLESLNAKYRQILIKE